MQSTYIYSCIYMHTLTYIHSAIETGAHICPTYVFGGNDFFENIMTNENFHDFANWCRRQRFCVGLFWGRFGLPVSISHVCMYICTVCMIVCHICMQVSVYLRMCGVYSSSVSVVLCMNVYVCTYVLIELFMNVRPFDLDSFHSPSDDVRW